MAILVERDNLRIHPSISRWFYDNASGRMVANTFMLAQRSLRRAIAG